MDVVITVRRLSLSYIIIMQRNNSINADQDENRRQGTISSARLNLLSSMVGGGSLSLPLAFRQTGNMFIAPILLIITSVVAQQSIYFLIKAGIYSSERVRTDGDMTRSDNSDINKKGAASYENMASQAFGTQARVLSSTLVSACCFFGTVGYAVLLRDMLEPLVDYFVIHPEGTGGGPTLARNLSMLTVVLIVSPLCSMKNLTALKNVGAASMASVLIVGLCVAYRSIECQLGLANQHDNGSSDNKEGGESSMRAFPSSMKVLLDAVPLFISSYICHFNVLPIHNELRCPTTDRVRQWVRTSMWPATMFYYVIGVTGSLYATCTPTGEIQGNILLNFDEDDPLLLLARMCLAMTITLAFPMLVIPARDIFIRTLTGTKRGRRLMSKARLISPDAADAIFSDDEVQNGLTQVEFEPMEISAVARLEEPLLAIENRVQSPSTALDAARDDSDEFSENRSTSLEEDGTDSRLLRIVSAMLVFWSAAFLACTVSSIDVVWDLLGSSFSIMMAFIIPCGAYLKLAGRKRFFDQVSVSDGGASFKKWLVSRTVAWIMLMVFIPLMIISTANAVYNTFFGKHG
jgi:amino acid permease